MATGKMRRLTLRAGTMMRPRNPAQSPERVRCDHNVLAIPTTCPDGEDGWSFVRGKNLGLREYWYVRAGDVAQDDFPDEDGYRR